MKLLRAVLKQIHKHSAGIEKHARLVAEELKNSPTNREEPDNDVAAFLANRR